ncbi:MAG: WG repeat-containing protein [Bacteroidales bacterium]|nr:WG repeat-containing protein [Bacteroidales bacterium]
MKRIIALAMVMLPLLAVGQNTNLTAQQSAKRIAQLSKIMQQYDTRYTTDFELHIDCGLAIFSNDDYQQGIIDLNGKILLPAQYHIYRQYIDQKATSFFLVVSDDKMGLIDKNMRWVLPMEYDHEIDCLECLNMYSWFSHGYSCMHKNGKYGAVDTAGRAIIPFKFDRGFGIDMEHRMLRFSDYDEDGSINEWITDYEGNLLIGPYESIQNFSEGLASFWVNDKMGFLDLKGRVVVPNRYDCCGGYGFHNGYAMVKENNTYMLIDKKGNIAHTLTNLSKFNIDDWLWDNSVFIISKHTNDASSNNYEYGAVDRSGKIVIQPRYRRWYVINDQYLAMTNYNDEMQCSMVDIYDKEGNLTAQFPQFTGEEYDETYFYYSQYFPAGKDALWGLVDSKFQEVLPFRYKEVTWLGYQYVRVVTTDGQTKIIDFSGKEVVSGPYELIEVVGDGLFKFYASNPDNIDELIVGYIDLYGNTTATQAQIDKMNAWMKRR